MSSPRLKSLTLRDFRSIDGDWEVPLDAEVILVHGANGAGKTSLLSAIELAATGSISHLERLGDTNYSSHLVHRGRSTGSVALATSGLISRETGSAIVSASGVQTRPLFEGRKKDAFIERCFLPQATLNRLFEVYAPQGKKGADTPLVRFVKEVLGLDALDALMQGLDASTHVRRIEKLSEPWQEALERKADLTTRRERARLASASAKTTVKKRIEELMGLLSMTKEANSLDEASIASIIERELSQREAGADESARFRGVQLTLDAVERTLQHHQLIQLDPEQIDSHPGLEIAETALAEWGTSQGVALREWLEPNAAIGSDIDIPGPSSLLDLVRQEASSTETALARLRRRRLEMEKARVLASDSIARLGEVVRQLAELNSTQTEAPAGKEALELASFLISALDFVNGNVCPVCDQHLDTHDSLRQYVLSKAEILDASAQEQLALESRRTALRSEKESLEARVSELTSQAGGEPTTQNDEDEAGLVKRLTKLHQLEVVAETGVRLAREVAANRDLQARTEQGRLLLESCMADLDESARILGVVPPSGLLPQRIAGLRAAAKAQLESLEKAHRERNRIEGLHEELKEALARQATAESDLADIESHIQAVERQIKEAKRRKDVGAELRRTAETLRAERIAEVIDDRLNASWSQIFRALVPSEPFVPQFIRPSPGTRQISVEIGTVHRDGAMAATPAAMLSQGNLNTAALALFIALHFAVPAELPWLIFDDPVQSMDDLHVSNFAALVKQLTRRHRRQLVISVHERELFDYLALELTPASAGEQLLTVVLDRTYGKSLITTNRINFQRDTALLPNPAA